MGCFSYLCKICNDPIIFDEEENIGEHCTLYLLEQGTIIEQMTGQYNHYGCVFSDYPYKTAIACTYAKWQTYDWDSILDLNFCSNKKSGIVAVHTDCLQTCVKLTNLLETQSPVDPDQGTGDIKHTTEGGFSQRLIEKPKTKRSIIPEEIEQNKKDDILMKKLSKEISEIEAELRSFLDKRKSNENIK